jgi:hypothetical protein
MGLFNSTVLEWAIGLIFVYLLLAIVCTTMNEWAAGVFALRSKTLAKAIAQLLDQQPSYDPTKSFLQQFYAHPLISGMMSPGKTASDAHPAYLEARTFATTVIDLATSDKPGSITFVDLETGVKKLPDGDVKKALLALIQNASGDLDTAQKNIEHWFNDTMERASGWYKHRTQLITVVIAAVLTIATNADTVRIGHVLWTNGTVRAMMVENAKARTDTSAASKVELDQLSFLLGWSDQNLSDWRGWLSRLLGWILTTTAVSLGSPFWFDLLNKFMNLRNAGKKPDDTPPSKQNSGVASAPPTQVVVKAGG